MTKQAELLPAWTHPQNDQPPIYGDGEKFRPNGEHWIDPADDNAIYISNGSGHFEGLNGKCVREHPGHTLSLEIPKPHSDEYARYLALELHCWVVGKEELTTEWLKSELIARGIKFSTCRIGLKRWKTAREEIMSVDGLTQEIYDEIEAMIQTVQDKRQELNAQWSKEQRAKFRGLDWQQETQEQQIDMTERRDLVKEWQGAFELARKHGIPDDKVHALWKQTAFSDEATALTEQNMDMLYKFIRNEIEVKEAHENARRVAANIAIVPSAPLVTTAQPMTQAYGDAGLDAVSHDLAQNQAVATAQVETEQEQPLDEVRLEEKAEEATNTAGPEIIEITGYKINKETGEIVEIDPTVVQELIGPVPQEMRQGDTFVIQDEQSARWLIKRIRNKQRQVEEAERELKELKNQVEVLKKRRFNEIKGIRFVYGAQLAQWAKAQLPIIKSGDKKGQLRTKSLVFTEGTLKFKETGGAKCISKDQFESWWMNLPEPEKQMYPHKVTYAMLLPHVASCLNNGIEIPGFIKEDINPVGDWEITVSTPRKSKKNSKIVDLVDEAEEEMEEQAEEAEHEAA